MVKEVKNYPNYSITSSGDVFNNKTGRQLKPVVNKGYCGVYLYNENGRKFFLLHRLVAKEFIPNESHLPEVNHKDENPLNNSVENLEWCTSKYNNNYGTHIEKVRQRMLENNPFKGKHHTPETRAKMSLAKKGKPGNNQRKVIIHGVEYESVKSAMIELKICTRKLYKILKESNENV